MLTYTCTLSLDDRSKFISNLFYALREAKFEHPFIEELTDSTLIVTQKHYFSASCKISYTLLLKKDANHLTLLTCGGKKSLFEQWTYGTYERKMVSLIEEVVHKNREPIM
ncbi:hypothetical protein [Priestia taiwanensis]|uniref:Uncharacterized protein n=1 Tax=Priestia taiwanensis TaxID=1347902 RepID=A0A917AUS7_9BACI|nr:hypothetical protein [Priestia taiwanensis]MBM7364085.1 hypothetical protein [Priestia taiwanensis]GGE71488.1 hypothetical protein GCM10007140_21780 [Priestia taiwanensis]